MDPEEKLRQVKNEYDQRIDAILTDLGCTEQEWGNRVILGQRAASVWADALREAAPRMHPSYQLDKAAEEVSVRFRHFLFFVSEFRERHRGDDDPKV